MTWCGLCCGDGLAKRSAEFVEAAPGGAEGLAEEAAGAAGADSAPKAAAAPAIRLWKQAAKVVDLTDHSGANSERVRAQTKEANLTDVLLKAMAANPRESQRLVQDFAHRAQVGLEVALPRLEQPPMEARVLLSPDLQVLLLRAAGRERKIPLSKVHRVCAGAHSVGPYMARAVQAASASGEDGEGQRWCATLELSNTTAVVVMLDSEELRDELVLGLLVLMEAAAPAGELHLGQESIKIA